jgi:hypothetical protein
MAPSVFDKYRIILLASEVCLNRDHVEHPKVCFTIECHLCHIDDQSILPAIVQDKYVARIVKEETTQLKWHRGFVRSIITSR